MSTIGRIISFIVAIVFAATEHAAQAQRVTKRLASDWKFIRQDADVNTSTANWDTITVPHTWNMSDKQTDNTPILDENQNLTKIKQSAKGNAGKPNGDPHLKKGYYQGVGWYAKTLDIPMSWKGKKRVFIRFEAACLAATTYINGQILGEHRGAFTAFAYELTDHLNYGGKNELRVRVDNSYREDTPPQSGDFNLDGGLYRPVELIVTDEICVTPLDYASSGIYLTQKLLTNKQAVVEVNSLISNGEKLGIPGEAEKQALNVTIKTIIKNEDGETVATNQIDQKLEPEVTQSVFQSVLLPNPHLWNGRKDPYLYTLTVQVSREGSTVDEVTQPLGLRSIAITKAQGFLLNGIPYPIHGVARHQDDRDKGWAGISADESEDAQIIINMGATAVRNAHYPQSESWHSLGDQLGLLMWDEVPVVNETRDTRAFWENTDEQLREMVHQLYNHPCIAWWGIFNEIENLPTPPSGTELENLRDIAQKIDPNRIIVAASDHGNRYYNLIPEQIAFNNYPGWYRGNWPKAENYIGDLNNMTSWIAFRAKEVNKRIGISEYGSGGDPFQHTEGEPQKPNPAQGGKFHPEEWQTYVHERDWAQMNGNPNLWGTFLWCIFDFASAGRHEGSISGINDKGIVTEDRKVKKDAYYFYKANWNSQPMVYISSRRLKIHTQPILNVSVFSNTEKVELKVNGKSFGIMEPNDIKICRWLNISLQPGSNVIEAIGQAKGRTVTDSCEWKLQTMP